MMSPLDSVPTLEALRANRNLLQPFLVALRRHLHQHPEIGFSEHKTAALLQRILKTLGGGRLHTGKGGGTGLWIDIDSTNPAVGAQGVRLAYRADIDALPLEDLKSTSYRSSVAGAAHLCGHDAHATMAIGVAMLGMARADTLPFHLRVFFQPNEEGTPSGAPKMIEDGVLEGIQAVWGSHVDPTLRAGTYGLIPGPSSASFDQFDIEVEVAGSGHSARPHLNGDAIWLLLQLLQQAYTLPGRITDARLPASFTVTRLKGSDAYNGTPKVAWAGGTLRCLDVSVRETLKSRLSHLADELGQLHGGQIRLAWTEGAPPVINDRQLTEEMREALLDAQGASSVVDVPLPSMGGEDFAHYGLLKPAILLRVGTASGPDTEHALHDGRFDIDESVLAPTAEIILKAMALHV